MTSKLVTNFKEKPTIYYSFSIAATWAGVGSLMNGIIMLQDYGIVPSIFWFVGNVLACIVFGIFAPRIPKLREVFMSKAMQIIMGLMCIFQVWLSMTGIQDIYNDTIVGTTVGTVLAYAFAIFFVVLLWKFGVIRNVLTDWFSWVCVYGVAILLVIVAIIQSGGQMMDISWGTDAANLSVGLQKGILLVPGAFLYPYFFRLLDYNDENADKTKRISATKVFTYGGLLFGAYLCFVFVLAWTSFSPILNLVKAILVTLIGLSTLSSFLYSIYVCFGKKIGLGLNIFSILGWKLLASLGVMGIWTLMSTIRIYIVLIGTAVAVAWYIVEKRKA